jgi:hypothetical protein
MLLGKMLWICSSLQLTAKKGEGWREDWRCIAIRGGSAIKDK